MANGPQGGAMVGRPDLANAHEQLRHFNGWVFTSIRPIAQRIAGQPIHVGRKGARPRGSKASTAKPLDSHPLLDLFGDPNELMVGWSLIYTTIASLELTGRQLWWVPKKKQILPIPTSWLTGIDATTSYAGFKVRPPNSGEEFTIPADECCYFVYPHPGDPHGASAPLLAVAGAVDADESITTSQVQMFRRGIRPDYALLVGKDPHPDVPGGVRPRLTNAQQNQIIAAIRKRYGGAYNHGEPLILDGLIEDVKRISATAAEMDWLNSGQMTKDKIMQGFGTNPIIAGQIEGANRASSLAAEDHFVHYTLNPKIELISQTLTEWLGPMFDGVEVWIEPCTVRDEDMALKRAGLLAANGAVYLNELREMMGLPPDKAFAGQLAGGELTGMAAAMDGAVGKLFERHAAQADAAHVEEAMRRLMPSMNGRH
jgi:phage portal protein BeeE